MNITAHALQVIHTNILAAKESENVHQNVNLLAVSKSQVAEKLREAYLAGQTAFGENYLQEAINKQSLLEDCNIEWHFIGPIQSNKTTLIAQHFSWIQSVDRLKIAQRLSNARDRNLPPLNICIQINSSHESTKSGVHEQELSTLAHAITELPNLRLRGLMSIPEPTKDTNKQREQFKKVKAAYTRLQTLGFDIDTLSMGMSNDYMAAIAEGATIVRIGSAIFGARDNT